MAQILNTISLVCLIVALIGIGISLWLWFRLDIYKIICDLSGKTEKIALEEIQKQKIEATERLKNAKSADKATNEEVDQMWSESKVLSGTDDLRYSTEEKTDSLLSEELETEITNQQNETELLTETTNTGPSNFYDPSSEKTEPLLTKEVQRETEVISQNETEILSHLEPASEVVSESITEKLPDLSQYFDTDGTMDLGMIDEEKDVSEMDLDLSSQTFVLINTITKIESTDRIVQ